MIKPFLSHKREDSKAVTKLRDVLKLYGAGGWKDTEDLRIGNSTEDGIRDAIHKQTGGFIWWGTRKVLESTVVNQVEIPAAFNRRKAEPSYPIVPLFVDLDPGDMTDVRQINEAIGDFGESLLACNGIVKSPHEALETFCQRAAKRYTHDAIEAHLKDAQEVRLEVRTLSEPDNDSDLTLDWRGLINPESRILAPNGLSRIVDALKTVREALQSIAHSPQIILDQDLPLPLAFLTGYEWRITT